VRAEKEEQQEQKERSMSWLVDISSLSEEEDAVQHGTASAFGAFPQQAQHASTESTTS